MYVGQWPAMIVGTILCHHKSNAFTLMSDSMVTSAPNEFSNKSVNLK